MKKIKINTTVILQVPKTTISDEQVILQIEQALNHQGAISINDSDVARRIGVRVHFNKVIK